MNFLYPQFLYGLIALSIPIIIHLFNFRKTKKIYFSNNKFLQNVKEASSAKLKLKHLLILAARLLFLFFLVVSFAQPIIPSGDNEEIRNNVHIYLDNSLSMSNETAPGLKAIDQGISYINEILELYPANTKYKLLTNGFLSFSNQYKDKDGTKEMITEIGLTGVSRDLRDVVSRINAEGFSEQSKDVYMISDFQKSTSGDLSGLEIDSADNIYLVPIQYKAQANVFVDSLYLANPFLIADNTNEMEVRLRNTGNKDVDDLIMKLFVNDVQVANTSIDIKAGAINSANFNLNFELDKINKGRLSFEEFPVSYDNELYFTLDIGEKINILEIRSNEATNVLEKVFANEGLFNFYSYSINNLDYNRINEVDLVILNELNRVDQSLMPYLDKLLERDGHLLVVFPARPDLGTYHRIIKGQNLSLSQQKNKVSLARLDMKDPFFENIFENTDEAIAMPEARNSVRWTNQSGVLLKHKNGAPYLSSANAGNIYLLASPLQENYTNFHKQAIFVPIMYRIAALSNSITEKLYYTIDEPLVVLELDSVPVNSNFMLSNEQEEIIPAQSLNGNKLFLEVPKNTLSPGFYDLKVNDELKKVLAFNYAENESLLDQYGAKELLSAFGGHKNIEVYETEDIKTFSAEITQKHTGDALWKYTLVLALLFLLAEVLLIRLL